MDSRFPDLILSQNFIYPTFHLFYLRYLPPSHFQDFLEGPPFFGGGRLLGANILTLNARDYLLDLVAGAFLLVDNGSGFGLDSDFDLGSDPSPKSKGVNCSKSSLEFSI